MKPLPMIQNPASPVPAPAASLETAAMTPDPSKHAELQPQIAAALGTVFDPEIPVNIYELGLIYDIIVDAAGAVCIRMTLTSPGCPAAQVLPGEVKRKVEQVPGVTSAAVDVVWDPPWDRDRMSDAAKLQLGLF